MGKNGKVAKESAESSGRGNDEGGWFEKGCMSLLGQEKRTSS